MGPHVRHYVTPAREKSFIKLPIFAVSTRFAKSGQAIATRKFCEARRLLMARRLSTTSKILGTPGCNEHGASLA
jgi:hypothetical protein